MHTIKYLHLKPEQQVTDIAWVSNENRVTKICTSNQSSSYCNSSAGPLIFSGT